MTGLSSPQGTGAWRFQWKCIAGAVVLALFLLLLGSSLPETTRLIISDVGLLSGGLAAAASCGFRSRRWTGRRRGAWLLFAAAGSLAALGNLWVLMVHLTQPPAFWKHDSYPAFVAFIIALLLGVAGMTTFSAVPRRATDQGRMVLDGVVIGGSLFLVTVAYVPGLLHSPDVPVVVPVIDVAVATFACLLIWRVGRTDRPVLALLSGGCALYAGCDFSFDVIQVYQHGFTYGTPFDVGWIAGYVLIALAAQHPWASTRPGEDAAKEASPLAGTLVMFGLVAVAIFASASRRILEGSNSKAAWILWLAMLLAVGTRQFLLIVDNDRLRHGLEQRVSERTRELRHVTRRSDLLLSSVGEGIYGVDRTGVVTFVNPAGARTLGYRPDELIGTRAHATFHAAQTDGTPFPEQGCYITNAIQDGSVTLAEEDEYSRADGRNFPVEVTATPLAVDGSIQGAVVVFRDITQRQEVDRLKSEFVSMVSHELRTPLTAIRGSLGLLAGGALGNLPAPAVRMVDLAMVSSARLTRLINDILDVERIESGTMPMEMEDHGARQLIDSAVPQILVLAGAVNVEVIVGHTEGVIHADADRVVQTLINLLDNAIKFSPAGTTVEVTSRVTGRFVEFQIRDEGRGIPADKIETIFRRFQQVDSSDAREKGGSGLGLAISRSVIDRLGGRIWAESQEGLGSIFRFTLPRAAAPEQQPSTSVHALTDPPDFMNGRSSLALGRREQAEPAEAGR
jgi:PAS domain S-box-containing protein